MLRLPADALDLETARLYCPGESSRVWAHDGFVILSFSSEDEDGDSWDEDGSGWLSSILPLRDEIAGGDHRALYLGWLLEIQGGDAEGDELEPPVPPGLGALSTALKAFSEFLRLDADLVRAAAEHSPPMSAGPDDGMLPEWIATLADAEKTELLIRVAGDGGMSVRAELLGRFRVAHRIGPSPEVGRRTAGELLEAAERISAERSRAEAERKAREKARRDREAAKARALHLDRLAPREEEAWGQVDALVASKQPKSYDLAVSLLKDLRDLAARDGREQTFAVRLQGLREAHAKKPSFLDRLRRGLQ
jgi:hypothetical protein